MDLVELLEDDEDMLVLLDPNILDANININQANIEALNLEDVEPPPRNHRYYEDIVPRYEPDDFHAHFRMSRHIMELLVQTVARQVGNEDMAGMDKKVAFVIWMLAKPESFRACCDRFDLPRSSGNVIFHQLCTVISNLMPEYIVWPTPAEANSSEVKFQQKYRFPGVIGAIDGCHIPIKAPIGNAIDYYNRHSFHSIILQGVCNENLKFIDVFIGMPGRCHDARVFRNSPVYNKITTNNLISPAQHLLGDSAYPLMINVMTPFKDNGHLDILQLNYNTILSSARAKIEQAFGRLKGKWRRLKYLDMNVENIPTVIAAACVLHNFTLVDVEEEQEEINADQINNDNEDGEDIHPGGQNAAQEKRRNIMNALI